MSVPSPFPHSFTACTLLLLWISAFLSADLFADSFRTLGVREGLGSRQVFQIDKDSTGFVWMYTNVGIDRYDGSEIRHYRLDGMEDSRDNIQSFTCMLCDKEGVVWVALKNGKIYAYSKRQDSFQLRVDLADYFPSPALYSIRFDDGNRLWLCMSEGLYYWEEGVGPSLAGLEGKSVRCMAQLDKGVFFAGTDRGIFRLTETGTSSFEARPIEPYAEIHVESLYYLGTQLFIGTFSEGVFVLDDTDGTLRPLNDRIPHVPIRSFARTRDNLLLVGADGAGVFCLDITTGKIVRHYMNDVDDDTSLSGNTVSDICVDGSGIVWISTSTNGVCYLDPDMPDVHRIRHERDNGNSLGSDHVNVMFQDSEGDYWYGTNRGVSLYRPRSHEWIHYLDDAEYSGKVVLAIAEDSSGDIWVGGYGIGVYRIHKRTGRVQKVEKRDADAKKGVATDYVYAIYAEGDYIWLGGIEGAFTRYDMRTDTYSYYPIDCIGDIKRAQDGSLLLAGCDGLAVFDKMSGDTRWYQTFGNISLRYPIRCLMQSSSGDIWLATDGEGLIRIAPDKQEAYSYTVGDNLVSNSISSLLEDDEGRIWFSTEKDLYCLDRSQEVIINANDFLDVNWGYYNPNAALKLRDGSLAFGTAEGVLSFFPSKDLRPHAPIELILTAYRLL